MTNRDRLKQLILDVFLLPEESFAWELTKDEIDTWDSLGVVSIAVGIQETFGYHFSPEEAVAITGIPDLVRVLNEKGISLD